MMNLCAASCCSGSTQKAPGETVAIALCYANAFPNLQVNNISNAVWMFTYQDNSAQADLTLVTQVINAQALLAVATIKGGLVGKAYRAHLTVDVDVCGLPTQTLSDCVDITLRVC